MEWGTYIPLSSPDASFAFAFGGVEEACVVVQLQSRKQRETDRTAFVSGRRF